MPECDEIYIGKLPWRDVQCSHRVHPMRLSQFLAKTVQMRDQQKVVHDPTIHGTHRVRAYTMVYSDAECTVLSGRHGMLSQPKNRAMKANQLPDEV